MRVTYCSSEVAPFSKTGGLGDVASALPIALAAMGNDVSVVTPWYRSVRRWFEEHRPPTREEEFGGFRARIAQIAGVAVVCVVADELYDRDGLYLDASGDDYADNLERFAYLGRACLAWAGRHDAPADVLHANDWQTSLVPILAHAESAAARIPSVITIHNAAYQGVFDYDALAQIGLGPDYFTAERLEYYGKVNLLKGGLVFADAITTVSPTYALEIQGEALGCGLDGVLRAQSDKLSGVLNGIDVDYWNPGRDPFLSASYSVDDLSGKADCKAALQRDLGLPERADAVLLGSVGRLDRQKGVTLILEAFEQVGDLELQLVCLGSGDSTLEQALRDLAAARPERVACRIGFDEALAHRIEAGADAFLMPSLYEPCGLNQMYSQRYGTVPIVRATGGLVDTVVHADPGRRAQGEGSGFLFADFTSQALAGAIREAAEVYSGSAGEWRELVERIMRIDHSWERSARAYQELYRSIAA